MTSSPKYTEKQYQAFKDVLESYRKKPYSELKKLADKRYNDTKHPRKDVQIGVDVYYDDKKRGTIRCSVGLYTVRPRPRWQFWDKSVLTEDFIVGPSIVPILTTQIELIEAHNHTNYKEEMLRSKMCACFYCFARFKPDEIEWDGYENSVGLCPNCKIDAILGEDCGFELSDNFLKDMHRYWFND